MDQLPAVIGSPSNEFDERPVPVPHHALQLTQAEAEDVRSFAEAEKSAASRRAYRSDFRVFSTWCQARGATPIPAAPALVAAFLAAQAKAGMKASTIGRRSAAIRYAHRLAGIEPPTGSEEVKAVLRGIRRTIGTAKLQKAPATAQVMRELLAHCPDTPIGKRDRALLVLGFAGAFRRSELVALQVEDLAEATDGLVVTIRRSKTDQEGAGQEVAILRGVKLCPVAAVQEWLAAAGITSGPVFRQVARGGRIGDVALSDHAVATIIKKIIIRAGLDPAAFSGHSLRAGFLTSAAEAGASIFRMMDVSRHKSVDTLRGYVRRAEGFKDHAGAAFL